MGGIVDSIFGGGDDAPQTDPNIGKAAKLNAQTAKEALEWYKQIYAEDAKPRQEKLDTLTEQVANEQLAVSEQSRKQAADQWNRYSSIFAPVEEQMVKDANEYDSAPNLDKAAGEAATGVQSQYQNALAQQRRQMVAMGVNPNSGKAAAMSAEGALGLAAAKAGAANNARTTAKDKGVALRAGAANFGRNMPNTASNAYSTSLAGGNSAVQNSVAAGNAANANAALMGQGFNTAMQGYTNSANILQNQYNSQLGAWGAQQNADATNSAGLGQLAGLGLVAFSSKKLKTDKRKIDVNTVLKGIRRTPVEKWRYKDGIEDSGEHIGPYAEDMHREFGDAVAPKGKMIDVVSTVGLALAATQALDEKVEHIDNKLSVIAKGIGKKVKNNEASA